MAECLATLLQFQRAMHPAILTTLPQDCLMSLTQNYQQATKPEKWRWCVLEKEMNMAGYLVALLQFQRAMHPAIPTIPQRDLFLWNRLMMFHFRAMLPFELEKERFRVHETEWQVAGYSKSQLQPQREMRSVIPSILLRGLSTPNHLMMFHLPSTLRFETDLRQ